MIGVGTFKLAENSRKYVNAVLDSERLSYGTFTQKFESLFAAAHDSRFAIMSNSGTSSLQVALAALKLKHGWNDGDEVIVPSVTFVATLNIVIQNNLSPVIVDVDPVYYEMDPEELAKAITPRTRCIIPVHLFGCPCDMKPIMEIAKKANALIIEDSCESMFVKYQGKSVGSFGEVGCFSTYVAHILTTGVGGLGTTNDPDLAIRMRSLVNHGRDSIYLSIDDDQGISKEEKKMVIERRFSFTEIGYSYRVTELEGALGLAEFESHEGLMKKRRDNADFFTKELSKFEDRIQLPSVRPDSGHSFMMYPLVLREEEKKDLVQFLEERDIETRDMLPLVNQPVYQRLFGIEESDFPVAKWINNNGFYIGSHHGLTSGEKEYVVEQFKTFFSKSSTKRKLSTLIILSRLESNVSEIQLEKAWEQFSEANFDEVIVMDASDHSRVADFMNKLGVRVYHDQKGKGDRLRKAVEKSKAEDFVVIGIDGTDSIEDAHHLLAELRRGSELVIGSRFLPGGKRSSRGAISAHSLGNRLFTLLLSIAFKKNITDCNNIQRGFKRSTFEKLKLRDSGDSIMFEMTLRALARDIMIDETPVQERPSILPHIKRNRVITGLLFLKTFISYQLKKVFSSH